MQEDHLLYLRAKRIIERRLGFFIHLGLYLAVNTLLILFNLFISPRSFWAVYPLISWGLAIYFHFLFAMLLHDERLAEWKRRFHSKRKADAVFQFGAHFFIYLGVCSFLVVIDLVSGDRFFWSIWALLGWGVGVFSHGLCVWIFTSSTFSQMAAKIRSTDLIEAKFFFKIHLLIFLVAMAILFLLNWVLQFEPRYSFWIFFGWGIGLGCHGLWLIINRGHRIKKWRQKKTLELMKHL